MRTKTKSHIFFVDDQSGIRRTVSDSLRTLDCKVTCFANAKDCLEELPGSNCNLLITDVRMPEMDGLTLLRKAKQIAPWASFMVITGYGDIPMAVRAMKLGAADFIEKPFDRNDFLRKVEKILTHDTFTTTQAGQPLTKTEKKILKLILDGKSNKEMAYNLQRCMRTVELHRSNIMHKFDVDNVVDLVKKAAPMDLSSAELTEQK